MFRTQTAVLVAVATGIHLFGFPGLALCVATFAIGPFSLLMFGGGWVQGYRFAVRDLDPAAGVSTMAEAERWRP